MVYREECDTGVKRLWASSVLTLIIWGKAVLQFFHLYIDGEWHTGSKVCLTLQFYDIPDTTYSNAPKQSQFCYPLAYNENSVCKEEENSSTTYKSSCLSNHDATTKMNATL